MTPADPASFEPEAVSGKSHSGEHLVCKMEDHPEPSASNSEANAYHEEQGASFEDADAAELDPEDFYFDGPYMVFTAAYHTKRGYCCNSECRHCPYK